MNGRFRVLDWQAAASESAQAYERVFTRLWQRGLERVDLIVSDGAGAGARGAARCIRERAAALPGALVPLAGRPDPGAGRRPPTQVSAGVLVDLGGGGGEPTAALGYSFCRAGSSGHPPWWRNSNPSWNTCWPSSLAGALATPAAHDQLGRRLVQTSAPLSEPLPRMPQRRAQRAGSGLLPARSRIDASMRSFMNRSTPQPTFNRKAGQCRAGCGLDKSGIGSTPFKVFVGMFPMNIGRRLRIAGILLGSVLLLGTAGFRIIEGWTWFDGFYMTLTTMTTIGYGEVHPLSHSGRIFNSFLIVASVIAGGFTIAMISQALLEFEFGKALGRRRMERELAKLSGHYIICGAGRVGRTVTRQLRAHGQTCVIIDKDPARAAWAEKENIPVIVGNASSEENLHKARIEQALGLCGGCQFRRRKSLYRAHSARIPFGPEDHCPSQRRGCNFQTDAGWRL